MCGFFSPPFFQIVEFFTPKRENIRVGSGVWRTFWKHFFNFFANIFQYFLQTFFNFLQTFFNFFLKINFSRVTSFWWTVKIFVCAGFLHIRIYWTCDCGGWLCAIFSFVKVLYVAAGKLFSISMVGRIVKIVHVHLKNIPILI